MKSLVRFCLAVVFTGVLASAVDAHITIAPTQSMAGATEKYVVRVPTESKVATVAAELEVPDGVIVEAVAVPNGWKHDIKRQGDRIVAITWTMNIPPESLLSFHSSRETPETKLNSCGPFVSDLRTEPSATGRRAPTASGQQP